RGVQQGDRQPPQHQRADRQGTSDGSVSQRRRLGSVAACASDPIAPHRAIAGGFIAQPQNWRRIANSGGTRGRWRDYKVRSIVLKSKEQDAKRGESSRCKAVALFINR